MNTQKILLMSVVILFVYATYVTVTVSDSSPPEEKRGVRPAREEALQIQPPAVSQAPVSDGKPQQPGPPGKQASPPPKSGRETQATQPPRPVPDKPFPKAVTTPEPGTPKPQVGGSTVAGGKIQLGFDELSLYDFITEIARKLQINYIIDPKVSVGNRVNLVTAKPIYQDDLFPIFQTVLKMNGAAIVKQGELYHIVPLENAKKDAIPVYQNYGQQPDENGDKAPVPEKSNSKETENGKSLSDKPAPPPASNIDTKENKFGAQKGEYATFIVPIEFLTSKEMGELIKDFVSPNSIIDYTRANLLIITEFKNNMDRVLEIIHALDGKSFQEGNVDIIKMKYYGAPEVVEDLKKVFAGTKDAPTGINMVPLERLNSILVVANSARAMYEVQKWVDRLDAPSGRGLKTFVYHVQNSVAGNIAAILSQLFTDTGQGAQGRTGQAGTQQQQQRPPAAGTQLAPFGGTGFNQTGLSRTGFQQGNLGGTGFGSMAGSMYGFGAFGQQGMLGPNLRGSLGPGQVQLVGAQGNMKVVVDDTNNSLIIQSSEADYEYLLETIKQLDVLPRQVLIDAKIIQVKLTDAINVGITSALLQSPGNNTGSPSVSNFFNETRGVPFTTATTGTIGQGGTSSNLGDLNVKTFAFVRNQSIILAGLEALRQKTQVKILQSPSILALDGQQARINVGTEVPVSTGSFADPIRSGLTSPSVFNSIQYRPTGTTLIVNPRINASGVVTMEIAQEVSNVATGASSTTPSIDTTQINTTLTVRDGDTVVIGGIIQENKSISRSRIPLLGDIPVVGTLFGSTSRTVARNELIVLITPRVIRDTETHKIVTEDSRTIHKEADRYTAEKEAEFRKLLLEAQKKKQIQEQKIEKEADKPKPPQQPQR